MLINQYLIAFEKKAHEEYLIDLDKSSFCITSKSFNNFIFMSKKEMDSTIEKNFLTQSTFERNTRYYDIPSIMSQ